MLHLRLSPTHELMYSFKGCSDYIFDGSSLHIFGMFFITFRESFTIIFS